MLRFVCEMVLLRAGMEGRGLVIMEFYFCIQHGLNIIVERALFAKSGIYLMVKFL